MLRKIVVAVTLCILVPLWPCAASSTETEVGGANVPSDKDGSYLIAATSKSKRDQMSAEQKRALRKKAMEWCLKTYGHDGYTQIERVQIKSDGTVVCYIRR
jgi:hypothetical protein